MLTINPSEVIWTVLGFLALYFLLKRFLYAPLIRLMDERAARVQAGRDELRRMNETLADNARRLDGEREQEQQEARALQERQRQEDDLRRAERYLQARTRAGEAEAEAKRRADQLRQSAAAELSQRRETLGVSLAERLLDGTEER